MILVRCAAPVVIVAIIDGALLGGVAAVITSIGGILAVVLSYRHGRAAATVTRAAPIADDATVAFVAALEAALADERDEVRALRAELRDQRTADDDVDRGDQRTPTTRRRSRQ